MMDQPMWRERKRRCGKSDPQQEEEDDPNGA